jgi:hypothetical protein
MREVEYAMDSFCMKDFFEQMNRTHPLCNRNQPAADMACKCTRVFFGVENVIKGDNWVPPPCQCQEVHLHAFNELPSVDCHGCLK